MTRISVRDLAEFKQSKKRFTMLTSYDSLTASLFDEAGIPVLISWRFCSKSCFRL